MWLGILIVIIYMIVMITTDDGIDTGKDDI